MSLTKQINKLFATLPQAHFLYKGLYQGIEVRIEGREGLYSNDYTKLFVRVYWQGHVMTCYTSPFNTIRTARKYAQEITGSLVRATDVALRDGWPMRTDYDSHVPLYRNYRADRGLSYVDYRRENPFVHGDNSDQNDHVVKYHLWLRRFIMQKAA